MSKPHAGYIVVDACEEWELPLGIVTGEHLPDGGLLTWVQPVALFPGRRSARAAIRRTEHYRLAFDSDNYPARAQCRVVPVAATPASTKERADG